MKKRMLPKVVAVCLCVAAICGMMNGCSSSKSTAKETVTIYTSIEDYRIEYLNKRLEEKFPNYDVNVVFYSTGDHIAKLLAE